MTEHNTLFKARTPLLRNPTRITAWVGLTCALLCTAGQGRLHAEENTLPDAARILDKYIEVTGGQAAYEKIQNRVVKGRIVHVGMGFEDKMTSYSARPNLMYFEADSEALGEVRQGCDGKVVWYLSEPTGPVIEEGEAGAARLHEATFDGHVQWRNHYTKAECVGEDVVDDKSCYKLVMTPPVGEPETHFYDKESNLLVRVNKTRRSSIGQPMAIPVELTFSDYKWVDGILLPHKRGQKSKMCGTEHEMLFVADTIEHNVQLPQNRFDAPDEVRAVVSKQPAGLWGKLVGKIASQLGGTSGCGGSSSGASAGGTARGGAGKAASKDEAKQEKRPNRGCGGG